MSTSAPDERYAASYGDLAGKAAIVTGTSRGIGTGIARVLGRQKMKLALTARSAEAGEAFAGKLRAEGVDCFFLAADLAADGEGRRVFDAAAERFGRIDLLVNNAAHLSSKGFLELDEQTWRTSCEANVRMIYAMSRPAAQHMAAGGGGCIIHISSVGGLRAHRGLAGYDAAKGAVDALTRAMAVDLVPHGIRVNAVAPGATLSHPDSPRTQKWADHAAPHIPLGRLATNEEIGHAVAFLASAAAAYITGQVLYVDGGMTVQLCPHGIHL